MVHFYWGTYSSSRLSLRFQSTFEYLSKSSYLQIFDFNPTLKNLLCSVKMAEYPGWFYPHDKNVADITSACVYHIQSYMDINDLKHCNFLFDQPLCWLDLKKSFNWIHSFCREKWFTIRDRVWIYKMNGCFFRVKCSCINWDIDIFCFFLGFIFCKRYIDILCFFGEIFQEQTLLPVRIFCNRDINICCFFRNNTFATCEDYSVMISITYFTFNESEFETDSKLFIIIFSFLYLICSLSLMLCWRLWYSVSFFCIIIITIHTDLSFLAQR